MYLFTSSDKIRDMELLIITSYIAVESGFDPEGVPVEKPKYLLTLPPGLLGLLLQCRDL